MGNTKSRRRQRDGQAGETTQEGVLVGAHTNIPNDAVPYTGPRHQYCFINVEATLSTQGQFERTQWWHFIRQCLLHLRWLDIIICCTSAGRTSVSVALAGRQSLSH